MIIRGPKLNVRNPNGRIYPEGDFRAALSGYQELIDSGQAFGEMGHPESGVNDQERISHVVKRVQIKKNRCPRKLKKRLKKSGKYAMWKYENIRTYIDVDIVKTPHGEILRGVLGNSFVSMRSIGNVNKNNKVTNLKIIAFDICPK